MSFRIAGRMIERLVEEGDTVVAGQTVARLENSDQTIALAQAKANLAYAESVLAESRQAAASRKSKAPRRREEGANWRVPRRPNNRQSST